MFAPFPQCHGEDCHGGVVRCYGSNHGIGRPDRPPRFLADGEQRAFDKSRIVESVGYCRHVHVRLVLLPPASPIDAHGLRPNLNYIPLADIHPILSVILDTDALIESR